MTQSLEDYLEAVGNLAKNGSIPRVKDIAKVLGLSKPSVHIALHLLEDHGMIIHEPYKDIIITEKGKEKYKEIKEKHDMISNFLQKVLGVSEEIAEKDACQMEHILSSETLERMRNMIKSQ